MGIVIPASCLPKVVLAGPWRDLDGAARWVCTPRAPPAVGRPLTRGLKPTVTVALFRRDTSP